MARVISNMLGAMPQPKDGGTGGMGQPGAAALLGAPPPQAGMPGSQKPKMGIQARDGTFNPQAYGISSATQPLVGGNAAGMIKGQMGTGAGGIRSAVAAPAGAVQPIVGSLPPLGPSGPTPQSVTPQSVTPQGTQQPIVTSLPPLGPGGPTGIKQPNPMAPTIAPPPQVGAPDGKDRTLGGQMGSGQGGPQMGRIVDRPGPTPMVPPPAETAQTITPEMSNVSAPSAAPAPAWRAMAQTAKLGQPAPEAPAVAPPAPPPLPPPPPASVGRPGGLDDAPAPQAAPSDPYGGAAPDWMLRQIAATGRTEAQAPAAAAANAANPAVQAGQLPPLGPGGPTMPAAGPVGITPPPAETPMDAPKDATQPVVPTMPPAGQPPLADPVTEFGPGNDLITSQFNPAQTERERAAATDADAARARIANAPDRGALAAEYMKNIDAQQADTRRTGLQDIGRSAAKFGRIGAGMTTNSIGSLEERLNEQRERSLRELSADAAGRTLEDRMGQFGALSGEESRQFDQNRMARGELRGERDYQYGMSRDAMGDRVAQRQLEDQLMNSATQRGVSVAGANRELAGDYAGQAGQGQGAIADLLGAYAQSQARQQGQQQGIDRTVRDLGSSYVPRAPNIDPGAGLLGREPDPFSPLPGQLPPIPVNPNVRDIDRRYDVRATGRR